MSEKYYLLPSKIFSYLKNLNFEYRRSGNSILYEIIQSARVHVREGIQYWEDNYCYLLYDIVLFLDSINLTKISIKNRKSYCQRIKEDLNSIKTIEYEAINTVYLDLEDENDPEYQKSMPMKNHFPANPDTLPFWKPNHIRLFISHRDKYKKEAKNLAKKLEDYGISAFVAHDTIEPMKTWQEEIMKGLETMEIMLAFITDDFDNSSWTNQEVGFALGRNIPVITLKLENKDPSGFIQAKQALRGNLKNPIASASQIYKIIIDSIGKESCKSALINKFLTSKSYANSSTIFQLMNEIIDYLSNDEAEQIIHGFSKNSQLYDSYKVNTQICNFLKRTTGKQYIIQGRIHIITKENAFDNVPF